MIQAQFSDHPISMEVCTEGKALYNVDRHYNTREGAAP